MVVVVMGVSGAGKSTVASLLADRLGWQWRDADDFHSEANVAKMHRGEPLTDADRQPWLRAMRSQIDNWVRTGEDAILACSALKRAYRQRLDAEPDVVFVYLKASSGELLERLESRRGHFAGADLLESQLDTLEEPTPQEPAIIVDGEQEPEAIVDEILNDLHLGS